MTKCEACGADNATDTLCGDGEVAALCPSCKSVDAFHTNNDLELLEEAKAMGV